MNRNHGIITCLWTLSLVAPALAEGPLEYNRDVRPILAENCFACHGVDSAARKADLRLDRRDDAIDFGAITPDEPAESELIARILSDDPELVMPPPQTMKQLTRAQTEILRRWIREGAQYQPHWSFIPPSYSDLPGVADESWVRNVIDRFVLARLEQAGLEPADEASPRTLFRRLHFDILGLPPKPAELAEFVADYRLRKDLALSDWIDRLMALPGWGEHRGRYWLDAARYADTHGLHFIAPSKYKFRPAGQCGMWMNQELLPWLSQQADQICWMRSLHTEAINHEPAIAAMQTGNQVAGRPCLGAWASYGLGAINKNLPPFVVLVAIPRNREQEQAISSRLWSSGYLSGEHAGVSFRSKGDPILFINNPPGVPNDIRRRSIDGINALNEINYHKLGDPNTHTRIQQYEMAFRMQASVPELTDLSSESDHTFQLYGADAKQPGTFANTVLMSRRLVERGVRFVQVYHNNWDHHANVSSRMPDQCLDVDQPCYALLEDLKQRGMLDETLVIWGGEFGRTIYSQGQLSHTNYGRDHQPRCFSMWMAGGGTKGGTIYGETDDFSYNIVKDPIHIRDFHATILQLLGFDHQRLSYRYQGLDQRLTGVEPAHVIPELLA